MIRPPFTLLLCLVAGLVLMSVVISGNLAGTDAHRKFARSYQECS